MSDLGGGCAHAWGRRPTRLAARTLETPTLYNNEVAVTLQALVDAAPPPPGREGFVGRARHMA